MASHVAMRFTAWGMDLPQPESPLLCCRLLSFLRDFGASDQVQGSWFKAVLLELPSVHGVPLRICFAVLMAQGRV